MADTADALAEGRGRGGERPHGGKEVVDELAQETKRTTLLDRVEQQLKDQPHVSRILFGFSIADDRKTQSLVEQEFNGWRAKQERTSELSGLLVFTAQGALHLLEGPTELLYGALELFHRLAAESKLPTSARPALIGPLRVLHFTELHGVRASMLWCSYVHGGKLQGGTQVQLEEATCADFAFRTYEKLLKVCLRVKQQVGEEAGLDSTQLAYKKAADMMPTVDEVVVLIGKSGADLFFSYPEFEKVFIAPFQLVLHSELLWPMAPALVY